MGEESERDVAARQGPGVVAQFSRTRLDELWISGLLLLQLLPQSQREQRRIGSNSCSKPMSREYADDEITEVEAIAKLHW